MLALSCKPLHAQGVASGICKPASLRTQQVGCWIVADQLIGPLNKAPVFWHIDAYSKRADADADKVRGGVVFESFGKVWLMTVAGKKWQSKHGRHVNEIGPLPIVKGLAYSVQYLEAIFNPGVTSRVHVHGGSEAWYMVAGEQCVESSDGRVRVGRPGGPPVIVRGGLSMQLTATGRQQRRAIALILYQSAKPATTQVHNWSPKGLCEQVKSQ